MHPVLKGSGSGAATERHADLHARRTRFGTTDVSKIGERTRTNEYVLGGYEASFGSYDVDDAKHIVTHHVQVSVTRIFSSAKTCPVCIN